jgi:hypothetical protein
MRPGPENREMPKWFPVPLRMAPIHGVPESRKKLIPIQVPTTVLSLVRLIVILKFRLILYEQPAMEDGR